MACLGNENCPYNEDDSNKRLDEKLEALVNARLNAMLDEKLKAMPGDQNNKKPDTNAISPQVASPDPKQDESKDESKSRGSWLYAITDIFNNLTKLVPTILNSERGFPALFGYGGLVVGGTCAILIAYGSNKDGLKMIYNLGLLSMALAFIVFVVWVFWDPDRPGRRKRGLGSGKKSKKQQNTDNNIDKRKKDDNMDNSIKVYEQIRKRVIAEQSKERLRIKIFLIENIEDLEFEELFSKYLKIRIAFYEDIIVSEISTEMRYSKIKQIYSLLYRMCYSIFVDLFCKTIIEKEKNINNYHQKFKLFTMETESEIYKEVRQSRLNSMTEKELMSLLKSRHLSEYNKVIKAFYQPLIRKFAEEINLQRDLKMSKERRKGINYATDDSSQLNKEKRNIYPTLTHNYLFHIPEIKRLSHNLSVTKETNILNHKFSFALQTNTNQCSTEDEQIQISITNNQKTKSNKLLRKKIKLNLN